jgi:hypothetical protein
VVWYHIAKSLRFGECLRCYDDRKRRSEEEQARNRKPAPTPDPDQDDPRWDPPETDEDDRPLPWTT